MVRGLVEMNATAFRACTNDCIDGFSTVSRVIAEASGREKPINRLTSGPF